MPIKGTLKMSDRQTVCKWCRSFSITGWVLISKRIAASLLTKIPYFIYSYIKVCQDWGKEATHPFKGLSLTPTQISWNSCTTCKRLCTRSFLAHLCMLRKMSGYTRLDDHHQWGFHIQLHSNRTHAKAGLFKNTLK